MDAEIIAVGSELLTPSRADTNSLYLTDQLNTLGVEVVMKMVVGDDRDRLAEAVRGSLSRCRILILTGGLGPTEDDVTREAVALALGCQVSFRQDLCDAIEQRFRRMNRQMAEINKRQAYVIEGAEALPNPNGTAPGQWMTAGQGQVIMLLPGPPHELRPMFQNECRPRLERLLPVQVIRTLQFRVAGMGESDLDQLISPVYKRYRNPVTTILAAPGDVQVHLRARCADQREACALLEEVGGQIEALLGEKIYSRDGASLESVVGELMRRRQVSLSVAESCTGGMLAERITAVPGSSEYFLGGFLVYNDRMKSEILGVDPTLIATYGAVSEQTAEAMAIGARDRTGSNFALSVTGVAGPGGGTEAAPVGTVCVGLAHAAGAESRRFRLMGDRARVRGLAVRTALDMLRRRLS